MKNIIAIANQKGGVGKSTTAHAIGTGLIFNGYKVLFIDLDNQCNLSYTMEADTAGRTVYDLLHGSGTAAETIQHTKQGDIIAGSPKLAGSDRDLDKADALEKAIKNIAANYDFIIIDTPPALGVLSINALAVADNVIIPAQADIYSLQGIGQLYNTIEAVKDRINKNIKIAGLLITRYNGRAILSRDISQMLTDTAEQLKTKVFNTRIREAIAIKEAQAHKQSIFYYAPKSNPAKDYNNFINELIKDLQEATGQPQERKKGFRL